MSFENMTSRYYLENKSEFSHSSIFHISLCDIVVYIFVEYDTNISS